MTTLATTITGKLATQIEERDYESALDLSAIAVNVQQAGLMSTPIPEKVAPIAYSATTEMVVALDAIESAIAKGRDDEREDAIRADFEATAEAEADRFEERIGVES